MVGNVILEIAALTAATAVGVVIHDSSGEICKVKQESLESVSMPRLLRVLWGLLFIIGIVFVSHGLR